MSGIITKVRKVEFEEYLGGHPEKGRRFRIFGRYHIKVLGCIKTTTGVLIQKHIISMLNADIAAIRDLVDMIIKPTTHITSQYYIISRMTH